MGSSDRSLGSGLPIGQGRQIDRMFCVTEYMLRMPHGDSYSNDAAWMVILADVLFSDVREASWLRRIIARRISAAARRRWRSPSVVSSAEAVKRRRRYDGDDPRCGVGRQGCCRRLWCRPDRFCLGRTTRAGLRGRRRTRAEAVGVSAATHGRSRSQEGSSRLFLDAVP